MSLTPSTKLTYPKITHPEVPHSESCHTKTRPHLIMPTPNKREETPHGINSTLKHTGAPGNTPRWEFQGLDYYQLALPKISTNWSLSIGSRLMTSE